MELISDKISVLSNSIIGPNEIIKSSTPINSKKRTNLHTSTQTEERKNNNPNKVQNPKQLKKETNNDNNNINNNEGISNTK